MTTPAAPCQAIRPSTENAIALLKLSLTQEQMFERLGETKTPLYSGHIGLYETGQRVPPLLVLLRYARVAGISMETLVDDELDLPKSLPAKRFTQN